MPPQLNVTSQLIYLLYKCEQHISNNNEVLAPILTE